ncbi:hypothetical protein [Streptomyces sp. NPDC004976]
MVQKPSVGRIVLVPAEPTMNNGADVAPAIITRVWNDSTINVRVLLDSQNAPEWRTSLVHTDALEGLDGNASPHRWAWPPRV